MRLRRLTAVTATVPLLVAPAVIVASPVTAGTTAAAGLPRHNLKVDAKEVDGTDRFVLYGKVDTLPDGTVLLVRNVAGGPYHRVKQVGTSHSGRFRTRVYQAGLKPTCFKVIVPATSTHRLTVSKGALCIQSE